MFVVEEMILPNFEFPFVLFGCGLLMFVGMVYNDIFIGLGPHLPGDSTILNLFVKSGPKHHSFDCCC